jgi:hypothetical protein
MPPLKLKEYVQGGTERTKRLRFIFHSLFTSTNNNQTNNNQTNKQTNKQQPNQQQQFNSNPNNSTPNQNVNYPSTSSNPFPEDSIRTIVLDGSFHVKVHVRVHDDDSVVSLEHRLYSFVSRVHNSHNRNVTTATTTTMAQPPHDLQESWETFFTPTNRFRERAEKGVPGYSSRLPSRDLPTDFTEV